LIHFPCSRAHARLDLKKQATLLARTCTITLKKQTAR
jgi:hypothetical protein